MENSGTEAVFPSKVALFLLVLQFREYYAGVAEHGKMKRKDLLYIKIDQINLILSLGHRGSFSCGVAIPGILREGRRLVSSA